MFLELKFDLEDRVSRQFFALAVFFRGQFQEELVARAGKDGWVNSVALEICYFQGIFYGSEFSAAIFFPVASGEQVGRCFPEHFDGDN